MLYLNLTEVLEHMSINSKRLYNLAYDTTGATYELYCKAYIK